MQAITLTQGMSVILDDEDFANLSQYHWCYRGERNNDRGYAIRHAKRDGKVRTVYMHREIMNPPPGHEVVFKNHDRLDCRRANLCVVTTQEARRHHRVRRDSKSGIKGVRFNPHGWTWSAYVYRNGFCYNIGTFDSEKEASEAYEREMQNEHPNLFDGPDVVERNAELTDRHNPDIVN